jgi:ABC-type Fe3+/spermidine/putrescine transport system ATPase subunit
VASFIGHANVIEARVQEGRILAGRDNLRLPVSEPGCRPGEAVVLVRPEDLLLSRQASKGGLQATIMGVRYRGDVYEISLEMSGISLSVIEEKERYLAQAWVLGESVAVDFTRYKFFHAEEGHDAIRERLRSLGYIE